MKAQVRITPGIRAGRRIIVYIAVSADGFIARPDGDVGWLDRPPVPGNYGMGAFLRSVDTILWGRKTWDQGQELGGVEVFGRRMEHYIFTRRRSGRVEAGAHFVREPVTAFARRLRRRAGKDIWMMGGAEIIGAFLDAGEIDAFVIHVVPTLIGEGIPLIAPRHRELPLELVSTRRFRDGVVRLHYRVPRRGRRTPARSAR